MNRDLLLTVLRVVSDKAEEERQRRIRKAISATYREEREHAEWIDLGGEG